MWRPSERVQQALTERFGAPNFGIQVTAAERLSLMPGFSAEFLGIWEQLNNSGFNSIEFEGFKTKAGSAIRW
jgi:hypothetical protein